MVARAEVGKHIHSRLYVALWSAVFATLAIIVAVVTLYVLAPQKISVKTNARGLSDGTRKVVVRAISTATNADILSLTANATVKDGVLTTDFVPPRELEGKSYVVEICTTKSGTSTESCSTASNTPKTSNAPTSNDEPLYSCPYYVSEQKSSKIANLTSQNVVEADNKVGCQGENKEGVSTKAEFSQQSSIVTMQAMQTQGLSVSGNGVVVASNGQLSTVSVDSLLPKATQNVTNQYYTVAASSPTPALMLEGRTLSLGTDNSVTLPADSNTTYPIADGTTDGIISATDWNTFASKENSLTFDNGLIRTGDTIGLMSCAAGQILKNDGSTWVCAADAGSALGTYTAGTGIMISGANVISNQGMLGVTASGALASSGGQNPVITLATSSDLTQLAGQLALSNTGVSAGTYNNVTVDAKGRVTNATNVAYLTTEADSVVGNEVAGVVTGGGLVMTGTGTVGDPYKVGLITSCVNGQVMKWNGSSWACANDIDTNTDAQTLGYNPGTNVLSLVNGGTVDLSDLQDNTDSQAISRTGNTISITGSASTVDLTPYLDNTDGQTLTITNPSAGNHTISISGGNSQSWAESQALSYNGGTRTISLTNGGSVVLPTDQDTTYSAGNGLALTGTVFSINAPTCVGTDKLQWNGSAFVCAADVDTNTDVQTLSWNNGTRTLTISGSGSSVVVPDTNTTYSAGTGLSLVGTTFSLTNDFGSSIDSSEITNGTIAATDLANSGATAGTYGDTGVSIAQLTVNAQGQVTSVSNRALPTANTTTSGILTSTDWNTFNGKESVLTFSDGLSRAGNAVSLMDCASSQILQRNAGDTAWLCANQVVDTNTTYSAGTGLSMVGTTFNNTGTLGVTASGALSSSGGQNPAITLATSSDFNQLTNQLNLTTTGVTAGTYNGITVDAKGRVTGATQMNYLTSYTETDGVVGNEVANVVNNGGLVMTGTGTAGDPYKVGLVTTCSDGQVLKYTSVGGWACANDTDTNTDAQTLTWNTGTNSLSVSGGNSVNLGSLLDNTDSQAISRTGNTLSITGNASTVDLSPYLDNTDNQTLSWNGGTRTLSLTSGGSVVISDADTTYTNGNGLSLTGNVFAISAPTCTGSTAKLLWSGTAFTCGTDVDTNTTYTAGSGLSLVGTTFSLAQNGATNGQVLMWNTTNGAWEPTTPASFTDTDQQNLSYNASTRVLSIDRGTGVTFPLASSSATGLLSSTDWNTFSGKENVLTFSDGLARSGNAVTLMDCAANQIIQRNAGDTAWLCANQVVDTNTTYSAGTGISLVGTTFSNTGVLGVTASGALSSSGGQNPAITLATSSDFNQLTSQLNLANTGVTAGTYNGITVDAKGRVTGATQMDYLTAETDGVVGNEVSGVATNGGLVMVGTGTNLDPYKVGLVTSCSAGQLLKYYPTDPDGAGPLVVGWNCASDTDTNTDAQTLTWNSGTNDLSVSGGNTVNLGSLLDNTDSQTLSISGTTISLTSGGSVSLPTANGTVAGVLSTADYNTFAGKQNALSTTGNGLFTYTGGNTLTGATCASNGQILKWNGTNFACASDNDTTYSAGTGISIATGTVSATLGTDITSGEIVDGTIAAADLANSGATAGTYGDTGVNVAQLTVNAQGQVTSISNRALPTANTTTTGVLGSTDWNTFNGKENVLTFTGNGLYSRAGNTITGLAGTVSGQVMKWNGSAWVAGTDNDTTYSAGNGISLASTTFSINAPTCSGTTKLQWNGTAFVCSADVDTDTTNFNILANGAGSQNVAAGNNVNFQNGTGTTASVDASKNVSFSLTNVGTAGTYGSATAVPVITTDAQGRVTGVASTPINFPAEVDGVIGNEVTAATANGGLARAGSGTSGSPYTLGLLTTCTDQQVLKYTLGTTTWGCANDTDTNTTYSAGTGLSLVGTTFSLTNDFGSSIDSSEITNGTIAAADLANSGATAGTYSDTGVNVAQLTVNAQGQVTSVSNRALPTANTTTSGILTSTDWNTFNGKENVLTFTGNGLYSRAGNTITGLAGTVSGQVMKWNGSAWVAGTDNDTTYSAGNGLSLASTTLSINSPTCSGTTKLQWNGTAFVCSADVDTDTTNFNILANGAGSQNVAAGNNVNFQNGTGTTASVDASKNVSFSLTNVGTAGTYGSATAVPVITTDAQGRVTGVASTPINFPAEVDGVIGNEVTAATANGGLARAGSGTSGSPYTLGLLTTCGDQQILKYTLGTTTWGCANDSGGTSYTASNGITLTGSNFTLTNDFDSSIDSSEITNGTIAAADLANSGATAGTYSDTGVNVAQLTVNAQGQVTSVSNRALPTANTTTTGILTSTDWNTFNGKENVLTFTGNGLFSRTSNTITGLAGTVTNQVIKWNGSAWVAGTDADTTYTNGTGIALAGTTFSLNCAGTGASGVAFCQGGNSFGQAANIGTNDAFALNLETGGTTRFTVDSATNTLTGNGVTTIASTAGNALNLDSGTTGAINIGTGANAKTLTFGNATGATGLVLTSGTAGISASTTASTTDGITFTANSITSATAFQLNTTGLTTGNAFEITGPTETGGTGGNTMLRVRNDNTQGFNQPRVIIGVGDTNNPDALARDQLYVFGRINSSWQQQWSECLSGLASTTASTAGTLTPNGYIAGNTAAGTLALGTAVNGSGICRITTTSTTTAGQMNSLSGGTINSTQRQYNPVFEARVSGSASNGTTQRAVIGFTSRTVNGVISTDATAVLTANNNFGLYGAYFRKNATDTTWSAVTTNNGTATTTGLATTTNAFHRLRIEVDNIKTEVRFYADGALVATHTTNLPPATQFFGYGASQGSSLTTAGTAITLDIDYMRIWSDDPPAAEAQAPAEVIGSIVNRDTAESNGVSTTEVQAELADEAEQLEAQLPGVVIDNSGSLDQIKLANGLLAKINTLDERLGALEAKAADVKSAVWNGGIVSEDTTFNGLVTFNSNVVFSSDSAGTVTIPVGETKAVVVYKSSQVVQPKVVASPQDFVTGAWRVTASTGAGFTIELQQAQNQPVTLDWHAFVGR